MQARGVGKMLEHLRTSVKKIKASGKVSGFGEGAFEAELADRTTPVTSLLTPAMQKLAQHAARWLHEFSSQALG